MSSLRDLGVLRVFAVNLTPITTHRRVAEHAEMTPRIEVRTLLNVCVSCATIALMIYDGQQALALASRVEERTMEGG